MPSEGILRYAHDFQALTTYRPLRYQTRVAAALCRRQHILLRAPTGAGKTFAVLAPFLLYRAQIGVGRLIYTLPLRALANGVYQEAIQLAPEGLRVTIQTGEQPDDPFFNLGDIIVTTYDQLLSGFLCGPYGTSPRNNNVNAAAVAGNLIIFDEFHLMDISRAFITGVECIRWFSETCLSVWMTATATSPLEEYLQEKLNTFRVSLTTEESYAVFDGRAIRRALVKEASPLTVEEILRFVSFRTLIVVNRVARAQELFEELLQTGRVPHDRLVLLHSRFFPSDRTGQQAWLHEFFGRDSTKPAIAIATQVVEAGLDLSCQHLLTELCPMNALVQRAGRCARFSNQTGVVHVYPLLPGHDRAPYRSDILQSAWDTVRASERLDPTLVSQWVEQVHSNRDFHDLYTNLGHNIDQCRVVLLGGITGDRKGGVADRIREKSDTLRLIIVKDPPRGTRPSERESIPVYRSHLRQALKNGTVLWTYDPDEPDWWRPVNDEADLQASFVVCAPVSAVRYTRDVGLQLGRAGSAVSPGRQPPQKTGYGGYRKELWTAHSAGVSRTAIARVQEEAFAGSILSNAFGVQLIRLASLAGALHDLGKLQQRWQGYAASYQRSREPGFVFEHPLAHTDYDPRSLQDRELSKLTSPKRPPHAAASAFYSSRLLNDLPDELRLPVILAILGHHGSWFGPQTKVEPLVEKASGWLPEGFDHNATLKTPSASDLSRWARGYMDILEVHVEELWPLTAYLTRTLRLADWRATEEASYE